MKRDGVDWWRNLVRTIKAHGLETKFSDRVPEKKGRVKKEETVTQPDNEQGSLFGGTA